MGRGSAIFTTVFRAHYALVYGPDAATSRRPVTLAALEGALAARGLHVETALLAEGGRPFYGDGTELRRLYRLTVDGETVYAMGRLEGAGESIDWVEDDEILCNIARVRLASVLACGFLTDELRAALPEDDKRLAWLCVAPKDAVAQWVATITDAEQVA